MSTRTKMTVEAFEALPLRDRRIVSDLARVRLLTGRQIERLHFASPDMTAQSRGSARRRTMGRLVALGLVITMERRIGGERAGSAGLVYTLDTIGQQMAFSVSAAPRRVRRPWALGAPFTRHTLDVAELYARLREAEARGRIRLLAFDAEPASWHRTIGGLLKPDAFAVWIRDGWEFHHWFEVDRATESLSTVRRKLLAYLDAAHAGDDGPRGVLPSVVVTVPHGRRQQAIQSIIETLPSPANAYFSVAIFGDVLSELLDAAVRPPP